MCASPTAAIASSTGIPWRRGGQVRHVHIEAGVGKARDTADDENLNGPRRSRCRARWRVVRDVCRASGPWPCRCHAARDPPLREAMSLVPTRGMHHRLRRRYAEGKPDLGVLLPGGAPLHAGEGSRRRNMLKPSAISRRDRPDALYNGPLGMTVDYMEAKGGLIVRRGPQDVQDGRARTRPRRLSRLYDLRTASASASRVHIMQMLNILEGYDIAALGFGTDTIDRSRKP